MAIEITYSLDPAWVRKNTAEFLASQPLLHNVILTLLEARCERHEDGRYWVATEDSRVVGVTLQSPLNRPVNLTPMSCPGVERLVDAMVEAGIGLPGVESDVATSSHFAGHWTERKKCAAEPAVGMRVYEVDEMRSAGTARGCLRRAEESDRDLLVAWMRGFYEDIRELPGEAEKTVDARLPKGQFWLWEDHQPASMAAHSLPVTGVVRVQAAYTPPSLRNRGYIKACVGSLSRRIREQGHRCMLYTDLANPMSNAAFRSIGYRCMAEALRYRFSPSRRTRLSYDHPQRDPGPYD